MDKINKEFGQLSGEELFKPITKRLDEKSSATVEEEEEKEEEEQEGPDYTIDEFDEINPFDYEFKPDAPTPPLSPISSPGPSTVPSKKQSQLSPELSLEPSPGPSKEPPPPYHAFDDYSNESDEQIKKRRTYVKTQITRLEKNRTKITKIKNFNM